MASISPSSTDNESFIPMLLRPRNFAWQFKSADNSQFDSEDQWQQYSNIDNEIIEDAYTKTKSDVEIDDDIIINFTLQIQYQKGNEKNRCSIKRTQLTRINDKIHLREERFSTRLAITSSETENQKIVDSDELPVLQKSFCYSYFYNEVMDKGKTIADVIEESAGGILKEGRLVGKPHQAEWLAAKLMAVKRLGDNFGASLRSQEIPYAISQTCIYLYTLDSFWYQRFNHVLREWTLATREKIKTYGPFCLLLINSVIEFGVNEYITVYRGVNLTNEQRQKFIDDYIRFESFTSTSRNRTLAEWFGNTLLILNIDVNRGLLRPKLGADISYYSSFPEEEEFLLLPGTDFFCDKYEYNTENERHILYLYNR
ncbi:hypothetical protein I4U23_016937 [Adineta vaga]|nr:hypothetical protein I4U23_016937 [Adineta vaga]